MSYEVSTIRANSFEDYNSKYDTIPWIDIFSYLDTGSLISMRLTKKSWKILLEEEPFWREHFKENYYRSSSLDFPTWREAVVHHFSYRKQLAFLHIATFEDKNARFFRRIAPSKVLFKSDHSLRMLCFEKSPIDTEVCSEIEQDGMRVFLGRYLALANYFPLANFYEVKIFDIESQKTLAQFKSERAIDFELEIFPIAKKYLAILCIDQLPLLYDTEAESLYSLGDSPLLSWKQISEKEFCIALKSGVIKSYEYENLRDRVIYETSGGELISVAFYDNQLLLVSREESLAKLCLIDLNSIHLELLQISSPGRDYQFDRCQFFSSEKGRYCVLSYFNDRDWSDPLYTYQIVDIDRKEEKYQLESIGLRHQWIGMHGECCYSLSMDSFVEHNLSTKKSAYLDIPKTSYSHEFREMKMIENRLFLWFDLRGEYDSDGFDNSPTPACYAVDFEGQLLDIPEEGIYFDKRWILLFYGERRHFLYDLHAMKVEIGNDPHHETSFLYYDSVQRYLFLGTNESEFALGEEGPREFISLKRWNLQDKSVSTLIEKEDGILRSLFCYHRKVYLWVTEDESYVDRGFEKFYSIGNDLKNVEQIDFSGSFKDYLPIAKIEFVENKLFILAGSRLCYYDLENMQLGILVEDSKNFWITQNNLVLSTHSNMLQVLKIFNFAEKVQEEAE